MHQPLLVASIASLLCLPAFAAQKAGAAAAPVAETKIVTREPVNLRAELKGASRLYLVVNDGGDGIVADWADWMEPVLIKADGSKIKLTELKPKESQVGFGKLG